PSTVVFSPAKRPSLIQSSRRRRMVVAEQAESETLSYPRPVTSAAMRWSKTTASAIRGLWQPSGWVSTWSGREARNSTRIGSSTHDGKTGTGKPSVTERQQLHDNGVPCPLASPLSANPVITPTGGASKNVLRKG